MVMGIRLGNVMVDCGDEQALCAFYRNLLGWEQGSLYGRPALKSPEGVVFLFIAPFLTMRLLAEENRLGTVELLLTNPVRDVEVVLGKFLGVMGFILVMLAFTLYFPALLFIFGNPDPGPIISGYLGVILQAGAFAGIGLAASSTTENQIVSAFLAFAVNLILWLSESISQFVGRPLDAVMKYLSITSHFQDFSRGVIDSSHVLFFLSMIAACLLLTYLSLQTRRWRA